MPDARGFGWRPDIPDVRDLRFTAALTAEEAQELPGSVDLSSLMPSIWDQGMLGSCTAHAVGAVMQYQQRRQLCQDFTPARLFVYYNSRLIEGTTRYDAGATLRDSIKSVARYGAGPEVLWPYDILRFKTTPPRRVYSTSVQHQALLYRRVERDLTTMRALLASGFPFVFGFAVYSSFMTEDVAATGVVPLPSIRERLEGGHAVVCVGYDNEEMMFVCRNSWGQEWGAEGYFRMPYDYVLDEYLSDDFWTISLVE